MTRNALSLPSIPEQIPINDLPRIYEALALRAKVSTEPEALIESARQSLGPALAAKFLDGGMLHVIMIDPLLEQSMLEDLRPGEDGTQIVMGQARLDAVLGSVKQSVESAATAGRQAVLVCAPALRPTVRRLVASPDGGVPVLSYREVTSANIQIETVGVVRHAEAIQA